MWPSRFLIWNIFTFSAFVSSLIARDNKIERYLERKQDNVGAAFVIWNMLLLKAAVSRYPLCDPRVHRVTRSIENRAAGGDAKAQKVRREIEYDIYGISR